MLDASWDARVQGLTVSGNEDRRRDYACDHIVPEDGMAQVVVAQSRQTNAHGESGVSEGFVHRRGCGAIACGWKG